MMALRRKLLRDLRRSRAQVLSIAAVVGCGVMAAMAMRSTLSAVEQARIQRQLEEEERRRVLAERIAEEKDRRDKLFEKCVIRPVMSDEDIEACRVAYRY